MTIGEKNSFITWDVLLFALPRNVFFKSTCWPHDPALYCSTKPIYLFFTLDRSLFLVLNGIWCLTPFCKENGTVLYFRKMLIWLRFVIELQGSALLFELAYNKQPHGHRVISEVQQSEVWKWIKGASICFEADAVKRDVLQFLSNTAYETNDALLPLYTWNAYNPYWQSASWAVML